MAPSWVSQLSCRSPRVTSPGKKAMRPQLLGLLISILLAGTLMALQ
jgi:hypothetical protein